MEIEMEKEKNIMIMIIYYLKANIQKEENGIERYMIFIII